MLAMKVTSLFFLSLISIIAVFAYNDLEGCDVGKGVIQINLEGDNAFVNHEGKSNEVFRIKWFIHKYYPIFKIATKNETVLEINNALDHLQIIYKGDRICDSHRDSNGILVEEFTAIEMMLKTDGKFMMVVHGNTTFAMSCSTERKLEVNDITLTMGYKHKNTTDFYYDCPIKGVDLVHRSKSNGVVSIHRWISLPVFCAIFIGLSLCFV